MNELNKEAAERIFQMLDSDPIIFIGSGLSIPPYKTWPELLDQLCCNMGHDGIIKESPILAAQKLYESDPDKFLTELKSNFGDPPSICRDALRDIATIDFKAFLTTNFDRTIELAFHWANRNSPTSFIYPKLQASLCLDQTIHYVHGRITRDTAKLSEIIFHRESYLNAYYQEGRIANYLFDVFFQNHILFTGFGLSDSEPLNYVIQAVIKTMNKLNKSMNKKWKILLPKGSLDPDLQDKYSALKIEVIHFDKVNESYMGLDEVWKSVSMKVKREMFMKHSEPFNPLQMEEPDWSRQ